MKKINCILLVDDNSDDNFFHTIAIKKADVCNTIKIVPDGVKALEYLKKCGEEKQPSESYPIPNLIYLDINMPRMNGFEFLEEYHKLDERLKSKVIIMVGTSLNPDEQKKVMEYKEVIDFNTKPLTDEMVRKIVEKYF